MCVTCGGMYVINLYLCLVNSNTKNSFLPPSFFSLYLFSIVHLLPQDTATLKHATCNNLGFEHWIRVEALVLVEVSRFFGEIVFKWIY